MSKIFDFKFMWEVFVALLSYLPVTLTIALVAIILGIIIGLINALVQITNIPILKQLSYLYVSFIRGTPLIVQIFIVYFGLPMLIDSQIPNIVYAFIAFSVNAGAFLTVIIKSSINSVDYSQYEASKSIGMTTWDMYRLIILPQAFRRAIPLLGNNFTGIIKGTSLAFTVSVMEITSKAMVMASDGLKFSESYIVVALVYFAVCRILEKIFSITERKLSVY